MSRFEKYLVILSALFAGGSGAIYAVMKYLMRPEDPFAVINHPWQPFFLHLHVLASPWLLFSIGLIAREHILGGLRNPRARRGRRAGLLTTGLLIPMVLSGYLIQVLTSASIRSATGLVHLSAGLVFLAATLAHLGGTRPGESARRRRNGGRPDAELKPDGDVSILGAGRTGQSAQEDEKP